MMTNYDSVKKRRRILKQKAVALLGGKCSICGYDKCLVALEFHHLNPDEKEFIITDKIRSWDKVEKELSKCILVCSNCHREIHNPDNVFDPALQERHTTYYSHICKYCGKTFKSTEKHRVYCSSKCSNTDRAVCERPSMDKLLDELTGSSYASVGIKYGVADNTVRKWVKQYGIDPKTVKTKSNVKRYF